jgi:NADH-quinone oxidoreductase subunit H
LVFFFGEAEESEAEARAEREPADPYAGGYPVPPMPTGGAVRGPAEALRFEKGTPVTTTAGDRGGEA